MNQWQQESIFKDTVREASIEAAWILGYAVIFVALAAICVCIGTLGYDRAEMEPLFNAAALWFESRGFIILPGLLMIGMALRMRRGGTPFSFVVGMGIVVLSAVVLVLQSQGL